MAAAVTRDLAAFSAAIEHDALPEAIRTRTRFLVLDLIGNIVRGRHDAESTAPLLATVRALGLAAGGAAVFGDATRYTPAGAALLNGALAHSLDFDDTHAAGSLHPGAPVIPAALAAAEMAGADGKTVLAAIVAGYEVTCRLAVALPAGDHYDRGYHPTATCGAFGAAAAAGRVFGLTAAQIEDALGIALSQSAGSLQFLKNGAWTKRFQVGWAAMAGLVAAQLAREGFRGAGEALEGKAGFLSAYAPNPVPARALQNLGTEWELMNTAVKPYPSCRYGHASVDAALMLRAEHRLAPEEIEAVTMGLPDKGMLLVGRPLEYKQNPQNVVDGQFSGPFVVSCALVRGHFGWDSYAWLNDADIRAMMLKVVCEQDPEIEAEFPANMSGKVTIRARGQSFSRKVVVPKGEPTNFLTEAELRSKFAALCDAVLGAERTRQLADAVLSLDRAPDVNGLMRLGAPLMAARLAGN
ncbi:MmgE/PrpD family protein [Plastoroseomonas hellenica]|uniref:MmgE/PrpD family protein n=1 Tax=Plastoroseomonas hellenica TaxID=2687306 RepID=UPI001BA50408|nr:MmgE/PrpD family protein [Plastoroseomonas hellenica]MBR0644251.1 MmgE/PrpD family protein [Plastoroseomonas hellenica]